MEHELSKGALKIIMKGGNYDQPILQILESKKVATNNAENRYRLHISDGEHSISYALLTTESGGPVEDNSVVKLTHYSANDFPQSDNSKKKVMLIMKLEILRRGSVVGKRLGAPVPLDLSAKKPAEKPVVVNPPPRPSVSRQEQVSKPQLDTSISQTKMINPIASLSPYTSKWVIKVRVAHKSEVRSWSNSRGEGKLFNVDLMDESGEIRCTGFTDAVEKFYALLEPGKVFYFSNCTIKDANTKFNTLKNQYELTMNTETVIEESHEEDDLPQITYDFVPISAIADKAAGDLVDVIGICKEASEVMSFTSRSTNKQLTKREILLVDQSSASIALTLWGTDAESFNKVNNPVVLVKGARIGQYAGGKTITPALGNRISVNPDIQESYKLKNWYENGGNCSELKNLSEKTGSLDVQSQWYSLKDAMKDVLSADEKGLYFQFVGTILLIRAENSFYRACPTEGCNKKVVNMENGLYRCEKCDREFPNFKFRLLCSMNIADWSDNQWMTVFSDECEKIIGKTAQEIGTVFQDQITVGKKMIESAHFRQYVFKCRCKVEIYNDERRVKIVVMRVDPINLEESNKRMISDIQKWLK